MFDAVQNPYVKEPDYVVHGHSGIVKTMNICYTMFNFSIEYSLVRNKTESEQGQNSGSELRIPMNTDRYDLLPNLLYLCLLLYFFQII